ncbi:hypothetical protein RFI_08836 [Reticulomyxa filosa]|uniref:Uncharacterized protein n=1 Tax=Reticulomyxa filosa TaxID=46433 RepID=X6NRE6_RETFI|nr:hypothetical protein RFI_08836 [Reticulomyxa filosa]|eukprot:ETO28299.1 hypothetical protein RFI_08836 [Reticulomyxa filosa]
MNYSEKLDKYLQMSKSSIDDMSYPVRKKSKQEESSLIGAAHGDHEGDSDDFGGISLNKKVENSKDGKSKKTSEKSTKEGYGTTMKDGRVRKEDHDPIWDNHSRCKIVMSLGLGILLEFYSMMLSVYFRSEIHSAFLPKGFYYIEQPPTFTFTVLENRFFFFKKKRYICMFGGGVQKKKKKKKWLVMPIGAILFGNIADKYGSSTSLLLTLSTMGTAVFIVGSYFFNINK